MILKIKKLLYDNNLTFFVSIVVVAIMPVHFQYLPPFMILWGIFWLWENNFRIKKSMFPDNSAAFLIILFLGFYLWQILGLLYAANLNMGFERIFKRLSFLLFPMVLFYPGERIIKNTNLLVRIFAVSTLIFVIYCFANAMHNSISIVSGKYLFNPHPTDYNYENFFYCSRLSLPVHPSYLSMYIVLAIIFSFESVLDSVLKSFTKILFILMIMVFLLTLYLLSSRAGLLTAIVVFPLYFLYKLSKRFSKWILFSLFIALILLFLRIAWTNDRLNYNADGVTKSQPGEILKKDIRYNIWKSALIVVKHNLVIGVGTGDATDELKREFLNQGYVDGYYDNLNAHNQFLEVLLENGLIGLLLFIGIFVYMFYISISEHNLILGLFLIIMIIMFMFETMLNRLAGVAFFPFFSFLLLKMKPSRFPGN
ncbi:MAG: O-antigen ligase family protein [Bacteroidetes bacterium]|nr:MAG: O-antigen ligase family protein [Bacteroidota bacterium]